MSRFTDPMAAMEEAEYMAELHDKSFCLIETEPSCILVIPKKELSAYPGKVLETINPTREFSIDD